ncbi:MAG: adenosylcobinamide-GDP ribazoletransferase [Actinomycetota bacterium]|nr:adenosylcobinamide-GDP ribazoletransferase [Actinomycetota bacterium]
MNAGPPSKAASPLADVAVAVGFLTVVPVPARAWKEPATFGRSFAWFPLVGAALGCVLVAAAFGLDIFLPAPVVAALLVALGVLLTGGLHLDGLMDACDGLFCARPPEERLEIMRDSRVGAFGVLGAVCLLLVKYATLSSLVDGGRGLLLAGLVLAPGLGRWAMVAAVVCFPYGRPGETLGAIFRGEAGPRQLVAASASVLLLAAVVYLWQGGWIGFYGVLLTGGAILTYGLARFALSRLPGLTGDVYGAIGEVVETAGLVAFVAWYAS